MKSYYISNQKQTDVFVSEFAKSMNPENIILLNGDLGTGKTYICSKIANYFGIDDLTSSSFQRVNLHRGKMNVIHCDFYRNSCDNYFFCNEIEPMLLYPWILLVEWMKPEDFIIHYGQVTEIFIQHKGDCKRELRITKF